MKLTLVTGSMFAGKTSYLIQSIQSSSASKSILVTHKDDIRFSAGDELINHDGIKLEHPISRLEKLSDLQKELDSFIHKGETILLGIDEAQFFPDIIEFVRNLWSQKSASLEVVVCGLNGDFQQKPFGVEPNWIS
jgi:thymidine kinase